MGYDVTCRRAVPGIFATLLTLQTLQLVVPVALSAQPAEGRLSARRADGELRWAQRWAFDVYGRKIAFSRDYHKPACHLDEGLDCFQGDFECPRCLWREDRSELHELGAIYDSVGRMLLRAEPGANVSRLNWLAGQRVGLWTRMGEFDRAQTAADECVADLWWCEALAAFVEHRTGRHHDAEQRFGRVLRLMPGDLACYWNEIALYRDSSAHSMAHDAYGRFTAAVPSDGRPCPTVEELHGFWTLADPLWTQPGNERMTEHFARMVDAYIHHQFLRAIHIRGTHMLGHHSVLLRHGWPRGWRWQLDYSNAAPPAWSLPSQLRPPRDPLASDPGLQLLYGHGQSFIITMPVENALRAHAATFDPGDSFRLESYASPYGTVRALPLQAGYFRRGGRDVLVVRSAVPASSSVDSAAWGLVTWDGSEFRHGDVIVSADTLTAWIDTPWQPQIISLEAVESPPDPDVMPDSAGAWRARTGTRVPGSSNRIALSSVVIMEPVAAPPDDLETAARLMLPTTRLQPGAELAAYWELYSDDVVNANVEVVVRSVDPRSLLSRIFGNLPPPEPRIRWEELIEADAGRAARTFDLALGDLTPGDYLLEITLVLHTGQVLRSDAHFSIERPG
jgi:hypothetical protein